MNADESITNFLFYLAPPVLVFGMAYFLIKKFLDNQHRIKLIDMRLSMQKEMIPLRMQAFERVILFLERISPNNLLIRIYRPGMTTGDFHQALLQSIRSEYEHNITQQVYMSVSSWNAVKTGRDELVKVINLAAEKCAPDAPGSELSKQVFQLMVDEENFPIQRAINQVKGEAYSIF